jgi:hypothetical protein
MNKCTALISLACLPFINIGAANAAPVTWDFIATGCSGNVASRNSGGCEPQQTYPVVLATFTLTGPDSSGSAIFNGGDGPATYAGDSFALDFSSSYPALTAAFTENPTPFGECEGHSEICQFNLSWSESAGQLNALGLYVNTYNDTFGPFGLGGGSVASDGMFAGCEAAACQISGYWTNPVTGVAEPGMLGVMLVGLIGLIGARRALAETNQRSN